MSVSNSCACVGHGHMVIYFMVIYFIKVFLLATNTNHYQFVYVTLYPVMLVVSCQSNGMRCSSVMLYLRRLNVMLCCTLYTALLLYKYEFLLCYVML